MLTCALSLDLAQRGIPARCQAPSVSSYISKERTRKLPAQPAAALNQRIMAANMPTVADAAKAIGATARDIRQWVAEGHCIEVSTSSRAMRLPRWQFDLDIWPWILAMASALGTTDGWFLLGFLDSPMGALDGRTPRQAAGAGRAYAGDRIGTVV